MDVQSLAEQDTRLHKASIKEQAGPCPDPNCSKRTDGFRVKWNGEKYVFMCRGCWDAEEILHDKGRRRGWGDEIDYLRHYRGMSFQEAQALCKEQGMDDSASIRRAAPVQGIGYQTDEWQTATHKAMQEHITRLWDDSDTRALEYARGRGLSDKTIRHFQLGYSISNGVPRLLIPSINDNRYVAIYRRDLRPDCPQDKRWMDVPGGTKNELYLADILAKRKDYPLILCEDAFSAMSIWQECGPYINVVATGSANCGQLVKWVARLARTSLVLVALDADKAGDTESQFWLERLKNARRMRPLLKDPNDMLQAGYSLCEWVKSCLDEAYASMNFLPLYEDALNFCSCGKLVEQFSSDGVPYCLECWEHLQEVGQEVLSILSDSTPDSNYWTGMHATLERTGYNAMFKRSDAALLARVDEYNKMYHPNRVKNVGNPDRR